MSKNTNQDIEVQWRSWYKGEPPRPIRLQIPGWAGNSHDHKEGCPPQPWHCPPFVAGSTYGLELIYPFENECHVVRENGKIIFKGNFLDESPWADNNAEPPFSAFAPDHYGFTSSIDIKPPPGYAIRLEPHPRFFTDQTGTVPIGVPGHLQEWWGRIFFVAFKAPYEGQTHIFRKGEPYAQILIVPQKINYNITKMSDEEAHKRADQEISISRLGSDFIANHCWKDHLGHKFDDKYKVLSAAFAKDGQAGIDKTIQEAKEKSNQNKKENIERQSNSYKKNTKVKHRLIKAKRGKIKNKDKKKEE